MWKPNQLRRRRGLTLVELLVGLSITAVTCGILAVLINATAMGTNAQNDGRRSLVRLQTLKATLEDEFANTRAILATSGSATTGPFYVVYWIGDTNNGTTPVNAAVNMSELRLLEIDSQNNLNIYCCKWPSGTTPATILANDTTYAASTDFHAMAESLIGSTYYSTNTVATGAMTMTVSLDNASPTAAKYVHVDINLNDGSVQRELVLGVSLLNPTAPW